MSNDIIPYPSITKSDKDGEPSFLIPEGINKRTLEILGCDYGYAKVVCGGRNKGKMKAMKEFIKLLREAKSEDVLIVRVRDPLPELRGNRLPRLRLLPRELYDNEKQD